VPLVNKSVAVQVPVWRTLRLRAEQSGVPLRDFLSFIVLRSNPVPDEDGPDRRMLAQIVQDNRRACATAARP
jgi:hypothetical protein